MGRGRSAGYDDQRELILERAGSLFARRGYPATSMNQVAEACGLSKATLYHYFRDKYAMLVTIAEVHVTRLVAIVDEAASPQLAPEPRLRLLIQSLVREYATAQSAHRVLTEDVRFLTPEDRERILDQQRQVVRGFSRVVLALRPDLDETALGMPVTMLLFGMVNWMFTWMKAEGPLDYDDMAPIVADLFLGGLPAVRPPPAEHRPGAIAALAADAVASEAAASEAP